MMELYICIGLLVLVGLVGFMAIIFNRKYNQLLNQIQDNADSIVVSHLQFINKTKDINNQIQEIKNSNLQTELNFIDNARNVDKQIKMIANWSKSLENWIEDLHSDIVWKNDKFRDQHSNIIENTNNLNNLNNQIQEIKKLIEILDCSNSNLESKITKSIGKMVLLGYAHLPGDEHKEYYSYSNHNTYIILSNNLSIPIYMKNSIDQEEFLSIFYTKGTLGQTFKSFIFPNIKYLENITKIELTHFRSINIIDYDHNTILDGKIIETIISVYSLAVKTIPGTDIIFKLDHDTISRIKKLVKICEDNSINLLICDQKHDEFLNKFFSQEYQEFCLKS